LAHGAVAEDDLDDPDAELLSHLSNLGVGDVLCGSRAGFSRSRRTVDVFKRKHALDGDHTVPQRFGREDGRLDPNDAKGA